MDQKLPELSVEIWLKIFTLLDRKTLHLKVSLVCKYWLNLVRNEKDFSSELVLTHNFITRNLYNPVPGSTRDEKISQIHYSVGKMLENWPRLKSVKLLFLYPSQLRTFYTMEIHKEKLNYFKRIWNAPGLEKVSILFQKFRHLNNWPNEETYKFPGEMSTNQLTFHFDKDSVEIPRLFFHEVNENTNINFSWLNANAFGIKELYLRHFILLWKLDPQLVPFLQAHKDTLESLIINSFRGLRMGANNLFGANVDDGFVSDLFNMLSKECPSLKKVHLSAANNDPGWVDRSGILVTSIMKFNSLEDLHISQSCYFHVASSAFSDNTKLKKLTLEEPVLKGSELLRIVQECRNLEYLYVEGITRRESQVQKYLQIDLDHLEEILKELKDCDKFKSLKILNICLNDRSSQDSNRSIKEIESIVKFKLESILSRFPSKSYVKIIILEANHPMLSDPECGELVLVEKKINKCPRTEIHPYPSCLLY